MKPKRPGITWTFCNDGPEDGPRVLGLNPWIHDFAAYGLWSRPAGLLAGLHMMRAAGARVALMDCLDRAWSAVPWPKAHPTGKGPFPKTPLPKPAALQGVPRRYSRYGHHPDTVRHALQRLSPAPDLVLVTTVMTYWCPGAAEAIRMVREIWPRAPVALGGCARTIHMGPCVEGGYTPEWARHWRGLLKG
ncbi:hypothetical protein [Desulfomicrobium salsuginis]